MKHSLTLLTPHGKPFMMLSISHVDGAFAKSDDKAARMDARTKNNPNCIGYWWTDNSYDSRAGKAWSRKHGSAE